MFNCDISNCSVKMSICEGCNTGGISGVLIRGTISTCMVDTCFIYGSNSVGGIIGTLYSDCFINNCAVIATIEDPCISSGSGMYGGIAGDAQHNTSITNCYMHGNITGGDYVGGISGTSFEMSEVTNCYVAGTLTGDLYVNGITVDYYGTIIENSTYFGLNSITTNIWNNQSFFEDTLGWDFENTWKMNAGNDKYQLPVLQFQDTPVAGDATYLLAEESEPTPTPDTPTPDTPTDSILNLSSGWNFISIPKSLDASNATALALFGSLDTAGNAILGYNAETQSWEQVTADTVIKPLTGYWVYSTTSTAVPLTYPDVPTVPAMKQLHPGWNAVGLSADTDTSASTFFAGLNWRVALPWSCENGMYDSAIVNGGGSGNSPDRLLTLGNGCWLYVEEANVLPGLTA